MSTNIQTQHAAATADKAGQTETAKASAKATPEQVLYANMLFYGSWSGLGLMALTYLVYVSGILAPYVPLEQVTVLWTGTVGNYLETANVPQGWGWVALLGYGDFLNFLGIVLLAGMTLICFVPLIPAFLKSKRPIHAAMAAAEVVVLLLAASGIFGSGGH